MLRGIYTSASGMIAQIDRQDTISNNLANVNTDGFKKDQTVIKQFPEIDIYRINDEKIKNAYEDKTIMKHIGKLGTGAVIEGVHTDFTNGSIKRTDNEFDFAIRNNGFFAAESTNGLRLIRGGSFRTDSEGFLISPNGDKILGVNQDGVLSYIQVGDKPFELGKNGSIYGANLIESTVKYDNIELGENLQNGFLILSPENKSNLYKEGNSYYALKNNSKVIYNSNSDILKGYLENSNVNSVKEMVEMIECSRAYETNQKVLTSQDTTLEKTVNEIGKWV